MVLVWIVGMFLCMPTLHAQMFSSQLPSTTFHSTSSMMGSGSNYASTPAAYAPARGQAYSPSPVSQGPRRVGNPFGPGGGGFPGSGDSGNPSEPGQSECTHCVDRNGDNHCDYCGHPILSCECGDGCRCPVGDCLFPLLFAALLFAIGKKSIVRRSIPDDCPFTTDGRLLHP